MNKQELIEKFEEKLRNVQLKFGANFKTKVYEELLEDLKQLDEPQEPVVPQFVADYIKYAKENDWDLQDAMDSDLIASEEDRKLSDWFYKDENMETFALAWINGYIVKEEKRYLVKMKGIEQGIDVLNHIITEDKWCFLNRIESDQYKVKHTKKQLEDAGFGWVFDCEGIEIEEVEE